MIILIIIIFFVIFIKFIYFNHLLFFLDLISDLIARVNVLIKIRFKVVEFNLKKVFPNISNSKINDIYFYSTKLFFLNSLIAIHQRFLIDTNYLTKYYNSVIIPNELKDDLKNNKVIFAMGHLGIFYDFSSAYFFISELACVYKINNKFFENLLYDCSKFEKKILPIKHDKLGSLLNNEYKSLYIVTDQKTSNKKKNKIMFLNQETNFHYSVADIHKVTKRKIWFFFCFYDFKNKKLNLELKPIKNLNEKKNIVQKIADLITERALKYPEQYFWHHDRFNSGIK